jgi:hypothetical protein
VQYVHSYEANFSISCRVCQQSFKKYESFKSHLRQRHDDLLINDDRADNLVNVENFNQDDPLMHTDGREHENNYENDQENEQESVPSMTRFIALLLLKTKEENRLTQQVLYSIMNNTETLVEQSLDALKNDVKSCLAANDIDISTILRLRTAKFVFSSKTTTGN